MFVYFEIFKVLLETVDILFVSTKLLIAEYSRALHLDTCGNFGKFE